MVLFVPLVRSLSKYPLIVHTRRHIRKKIQNKSNYHRDASSDFDGDPFAAEEDALYDIRIKRTDITLSPGGTPALVGATVGLSGGSTGSVGAINTGTTITNGSASDSKDGLGVVVMGSGRSVSGDSLGLDGSSGQGRFRVDSQEYYSPLSEINSFLPGMNI